MEGQDNVMDAALETEDGKTADQLLKDIQDKQRELRDSSKDQPKPEPVQEPEPDEELESEVPGPEAQGKPSETESTSDSEEVVAPSGEGDKATEEWMKKKGFKNVHEMGRSLRNLERELSRRPKGPSERGTRIPRPEYPAPAYAPPAPSYRPQPQMVEDLAKQYNMDPEDLQRVAPLAADIAANAIRHQVQPLMKEVTRLNKQVARDAEIKGLESDPAYHNPDVQIEMYKVLEEDPSIFQNEPAPYRYAFNEALGSIGRRILEGKSQPSKALETKVPESGGEISKKPPVMARGSGPGGGGKSGKLAPTQLSRRDFASLPLAEKKRLLKEAGAIQGEDDFQSQ